MSNGKTGNAATASRAPQPAETNPLDFVDRAQAIIQAAVAEAKKELEMNVAVVDSGAISWPSNAWTVRCLLPFGLPSTRHEQPRPSGAKRSNSKTVSSSCYLLAFDGIIASRGGIPLIEQGAIIGAIGCSGGTDSQDEIGSQAGAALINQLPGKKQMIQISGERWEQSTGFRDIKIRRRMPWQLQAHLRNPHRFA